MNDLPATSNPLQNSIAAAPRNLAVSNSGQAEVQRAIAEVQAAILLAKQFPRDYLELTQRIERQCSLERIAKAATYTYARGGSNISGPSIRLAEMIAQSYGNFQFGWNEVNRAQGQSEVVVYAWDTETNARTEMKFFVKHLRDTKGGPQAVRDERDIYEIMANQASRRLRACILRLIPADLIEVALEASQRTMAATFKITPEYIGQIVEAFKAFGVSKTQIEVRLQRKMDAITPGLAVNLEGIYNSLKDGMSQPGDWFEPEATGGDGKPGSRADAIKDKLRKEKPAETPHDPATGEVIEQGKPKAELPVKEEPEPRKEGNPGPDDHEPIPAAKKAASAEVPQIPARPLPGDATKTDWESWVDAWNPLCFEAESKNWLIALRHKHKSLLDNMKRMAPDAFARAEAAYNAAMAMFEDGGQA